MELARQPGLADVGWVVLAQGMPPGVARGDALGTVDGAGAPQAGGEGLGRDGS